MVGKFGRGIGIMRQENSQNTSAFFFHQAAWFANAYTFDAFVLACCCCCLHSGGESFVSSSSRIQPFVITLFGSLPKGGDALRCLWYPIDGG